MRYLKLIQALGRLKHIKDRIDHHPEANVLEHSLQAYNIAKRESNDTKLQVAALYHDIGKQINTLQHEKYSIDILKSFGYYNEKVFWLIENHIRIIWFLDGSMKKKKKIQEMFTHKYFTDLIHLRRIDNSARNPNKITKLDEESRIKLNKLLEETNERRS